MKRIYIFSTDKTDGSREDREILGGKGANLAEMTRIGLPVPPGFTITTETCNEYYRLQKHIPDGLIDQVISAISFVEQSTGKSFGGENPLLFSVRSGAKISMPGMMDTILNLGLNDITVQYLAEQSQNEWFAYDSYRRFLQMFGDVALGIDIIFFDEAFDALKKEIQVEKDQDLSLNNLKQIIETYKNIIIQHTGSPFPQDPMLQIEKAIIAVFESWNNDRAIYYRNLNAIPHHLGTAVNIQSMVYGNMGEDSATGVAFTRNPITGEKKFFGEYLINAQGEDVVAGVRTPLPISKEDGEDSMEDMWPEMYHQLSQLAQQLEDHYKDMQDIEFTIERNTLYLLQTRTGKRTGKAMVNIALDFVNEGSISREEAIERIDTTKINELLHPTIGPDQVVHVIAQGLAASPGVATGKIVFSSLEAERYVQNGEKVILARIETSAEDIHGMDISEGIVTARGGMTSHAAVVARGMGTPCIAGCKNIIIDYKENICRVQQDDKESLVLHAGDWVTLNGTTGEVILGKLETIPANITYDLQQILLWSDEIRSLGVRTNADTPKDARRAREFGAEGIGLCRTEHMFFQDDRITYMREMILARSTEERRHALQKLLPMQRTDFLEIYKEMTGFPVTIRFLDPPLHEFLPEKKSDIEKVAYQLGCSYNEVKLKIKELHEVNPMLGLRGCRLGILYPEIIEMQAQAVFEAAFLASQEGITITPEIMIPLVSNPQELAYHRDTIDRIYATVEQNLEYNPEKKTLTYCIGTMIELPRAALMADQIAEYADFFSFGTNDLTQTTYGLSRDDAGKFLPLYKEQGFIEHDPFVVLDQNGVGQLISIGVEKGRAQKSHLKIGLCGEHGGEPSSIDFCYRTGLDYVSCSPFRVPIARIAAAQAAIKHRNQEL